MFGKMYSIQVTQLYRYLSSMSLFFLSLDIQVRGDAKMSAQQVEQHLEMGKMFLAKGQFADALTHYHAAIEGDPENYLTYYRRATVYLAMGKSKSALDDLNKVVKLRPDFAAARMQRGNVLMKQGELDLAYIDYEQVLQTQPDNIDAMKYLDTIEPLKHDIDEAYQLLENGDCHHAIELLTTAIEYSPWDPELREARAECYQQFGDYFRAIQDMKPTTKLRNDNTKAYYKISLLHYHMGEAEESLKQIRECLKLDPEHKDCFPHYKKVKKLFKQQNMVDQFIQENRYDDCISKAEAALKTEPSVDTYVIRNKGKICHCYSQAKQGKLAIAKCTELIDKDPHNVDARLDRAEGYIVEEMFEEAIQDLQTAHKDEDSQRVNDALTRAQKLLKQSKKKDYYKILGVRRNARKSEIIKAYRKLAVKWHPDKYEGEDKKKAEQNFIDIAAAKEVLTDPEKKAKFDSGEDPLDPETQQGQQFRHGFQGFPQGFQFKFHF